MSNALICDTCGETFPEGQENSMSGNGTFTRTVDGVRKEMQRRQDQCAPCVTTQDSRMGVGTNRRALTPAEREVTRAVERTNGHGNPPFAHQ